MTSRFGQFDGGLGSNVTARRWSSGDEFEDVEMPVLSGTVLYILQYGTNMNYAYRSYSHGINDI